MDEGGHGGEKAIGSARDERAGRQKTGPTLSIVGAQSMMYTYSKTIVCNGDKWTDAAKAEGRAERQKTDARHRTTLESVCTRG